MSASQEERELAARINKTAGKTIAHPDVLIELTHTNPDARRLRQLQESRMGTKLDERATALRRGSG